MKLDEATERFNEINLNYKDKKILSKKNSMFGGIGKVLLVNILKEDEKQINEYDVLVFFSFPDGKIDVYNYKEFEKYCL